MSIYEDCRNRLLANRKAEQEAIRRAEHQVTALYEAFVATIGAPVESVLLLNAENRELHPDDLAADRNNTWHFRIQLNVRAGDEILQTIEYMFAVTPAIGGGVVVNLNGKQIQGRLSALNDQVVVSEMVALIHRIA